jgi:iron(III) transport system ATP-binding protein
MTVFENVAFPLVHGGFKVRKSEVRDKVKRALELVGLGTLENRPAPLLSGGQQQRVSLARALVYEPRLLLLDEPLSNLDAKLREEMRLELKELIDRLKITSLYVTHDQEEALVLSDRIAVMNEGQILQEGTPREIYLNPLDPFVASFVGRSNIVEGQVRRIAGDAGSVVVETAFGDLVCTTPRDLKTGEPVSVVFRPEDISVSTDMGRKKTNNFAGVLDRMIFVGNRTHCEIRLGSILIHTEINSRIDIPPGTKVTVEIPPDHVYGL